MTGRFIAGWAVNKTGASRPICYGICGIITGILTAISASLTHFPILLAYAVCYGFMSGVYSSTYYMNIGYCRHTVVILSSRNVLFFCSLLLQRKALYKYLLLLLCQVNHMALYLYVCVCVCVYDSYMIYICIYVYNINIL